MCDIQISGENDQDVKLLVSRNDGTEGACKLILRLVSGERVGLWERIT